MLNALRITRTRVLLACTVAIGAGALAAGLAVAGGGGPGVYVPQLGVNVPADKVAAVNHTLPGSAAESAIPTIVPQYQADPIAARLLGPDVPVPISPQVIQPTGGWLVSDGKNLVAVYAGTAGADQDQGRFVIVRQDFAAGGQTVEAVDAGHTGALTILGQPAGSRRPANPVRGDLSFRGAHGAQGTLHLLDDSLELH